MLVVVFGTDMKASNLRSYTVSQIGLVSLRLESSRDKDIGRGIREGRSGMDDKAYLLPSLFLFFFIPNTPSPISSLHAI